MKILLEYIIVFIIIYLGNSILFVGKNKKFDKNRVPVELNYLVTLYNIDIKKLNYKKFLNNLSLINAFIISTIYIIVIYLVKKIFLQIIIGIVLLILMIIICYGLLGRYYERKNK